jgi:DNA polymerase elongation subunit (family B)
MSFESNCIEDYIRIHKIPELGIKYLKSLAEDVKIDGNDSDGDLEEKENGSDGEIVEIEGDTTIIDDDIDITGKNTSIYDKDIEFQILDIDSYHTEDDDEKKMFNIMLFGKTRDNKSVYVNVEKFTPYFFVEVDSAWRMDTIKKIIEDIKKCVPKALREGLISYNIVKKHKFKGFTNDEEFNFLHLIFNDYDSMKSYTYAFEKKHTMLYISRHRKVSFNLYESAIPPIIRFLHMQKLDPIGWCKISKEHFKPFKYEHRKGMTNININCDWKHVQRVETADIHKFTVLSFDIECLSEDGKFPHNRDGDKVIQIGMTYSYLGDTECYKQVILCLGKTSPIPDADVICFNTEQQLLLAFTDAIKKEDPDIIIGYNTHGFDWDYLKNRAKKFEIYSQFSRMSRIKGHVCKYVEQKLESAALGRNNLKYYHIPGRICIDLMKVVQREHKLNGYSLDNVAANFIKDDIKAYQYIRCNELDNIKKINTFTKEENEYISKIISNIDKDDDCYSSDDDDVEDLDEDVHLKKIQDVTNKKKILFTKLKVKSVFGIKKNDYIAIYYNDGPTDNRIGKKYRILHLNDSPDDTSILLEGKIRIRPFLKKKWKVFWCQAKDDVGPQDIFRLYKIGAKERSIVAKYCLKDCSLCNRLIAKLYILPNSIGMGNVCCVPLSYLFLRGQSIKIFSLVAKQCREENYLIPALKRKFKKKPQLDEKGNIIPDAEMTQEKQFQRFLMNYIKEEEDDDDDDDEDKYEGATVFDPVKGVHYEPIIVGDYSSLYPSSMIEMNFSHNSIVLDPKYDNLPGHTYCNQVYNNPDGTQTTCRFEQGIEGKKATIPRILQKLLSERKKYKNLMEAEKDLFKKAVWDGLQLAYKVTANSLYGQCGSSVSPISMKAIAACTTSRGRDMLEGARHFVENEMTHILNLIEESYLINDDTKYLDYIGKYYTNVPDQRVEKGKSYTDPNTGKTEMKWTYKGKHDFFQWIKKQIHDIIKGYSISPVCIYGDTDSVFFKLNLVNAQTELADKSHDALKISIKIGILVLTIYNYTLKSPQCLAYEKVYWPFIILSKKRYVGNLFEEDPDKFKQKSMGLVTKRRDNADIVKVVVGGIIDQILNKRNPAGAANLTKTILKRTIENKYGIDKFILSKTLRDKDTYKDWTRMVHVVLADRMAQRDPGNKPQSNDRIPFVYIETKKKVKLQGERVEHPVYIQDNSLQIDFSFYITNQIMKPAMQFLEHIVINPKAIFNMYLIREENRKSGIAPIMKYYKDCVMDSGNSVSVGIDSKDLFGTELKSAISKKNTKRKEKRVKVKKMFGN